MGKPDDVSQEAWDAARKAIGAEDVYVGRLSHQIILERVARAIMYAKVEERDACISVLAGMIQYDGSPGATTVLPYADMTVAMRAIRKRGDVNTAHNKNKSQEA